MEDDFEKEATRLYNVYEAALKDYITHVSEGDLMTQHVTTVCIMDTESGASYYALVKPSLTPEHSVRGLTQKGVELADDTQTFSMVYVNADDEEYDEDDDE